MSLFSLTSFLIILVDISETKLISLSILENQSHHANLVDNILMVSHGGVFFCILASITLLLGCLLCPSMPLNKIRLSRVYLLFSGLLFLGLCHDIRFFLFFTLCCYLILTKSAYHHINSYIHDEYRELRVHAFTFYQQITSIGLFVALIDNLFIAGPEVIFSNIGVIALTFACFSSIGVFPFHSWVVPFLSAPRSTIFLPMFVIQLGLLILYKIYTPLMVNYRYLFDLCIVLSILGLLHAALSLFGEKRLKRIPAYLYLSHISLTILSLGKLGDVGEIISYLDSSNLIISSCGLIGVTAVLSARLGIKGILYSTGLAASFPELGVCFLICALSLVSFPGTLGFIEEEFILEAGMEHNLIIIMCFAFSITLNGFSCFRLFARIFYGPKSEDVDPELTLNLREKITYWLIVFILITNGLAPNLLLKIISHS